MNSSPYIQSDVLGIQVARFFSNELKIPFHAVVGDFGEYDVASIDGKIRIEIKRESTPIRTGNATLEFWNLSYDKPSGILGTAANTWLHFILEGDGYVGYEFDVNVVRKLAIEHGVTKSNGGNSLFKLVALEIFRKHARRNIRLEKPTIAVGALTTSLSLEGGGKSDAN